MEWSVHFVHKSKGIETRSWCVCLDLRPCQFPDGAAAFTETHFATPVHRSIGRRIDHGPLSRYIEDGILFTVRLGIHAQKGYMAAVRAERKCDRQIPEVAADDTLPCGSRRGEHGHFLPQRNTQRLFSHLTIPSHVCSMNGFPTSSGGSCRD